MSDSAGKTAGLTARGTSAFGTQQLGLIRDQSAGPSVSESSLMEFERRQGTSLVESFIDTAQSFLYTVVDLPLIGREDERAREVGRRAGTNAFIALSALLLAIVVRHVTVNGLGTVDAVSFEIGALVLGWAVYVGTGIYYTRAM
jgi:hypothetical protein